MSRFSIPLEALTSRLDLGSRFESVRSQSIITRFSTLKPIGEFLDLKRVSKPANFAEVQSRVNYNLAYFQSNYFAVATMLAIYSLLNNRTLLFDMIFMGAGLFAIRRLEGRDANLGFTTLTSSQLYTGLFIIGIPVFIWASPLATALCFFRGGGLGGRPRTPKDSPLWGRPSGARQGKRRGEAFGRNSYYGGDGRVEEIDSDEDDGQGVGLDGKFVSDELHFTGADLSRRSRRRKNYEYSDTSTSSDEGEDEGNSDDMAGGRLQVALRDKEDLLVEQALARIRRAQELGKPNVKLSKPELEALQRKRHNDSANSRTQSRSDLRNDDRQRSRNPSRKSSKEVKASTKRKDKDRLPSASTSRHATPPGILIPGPSPTYAPLGYPPPQPQGQPSNRYSTAPTSSSQQNLPRRLPDDPNWMPPRPHSSSSLSPPYPVDPFKYQTYAPPVPQRPVQYTQGRRVVSSPQSVRSRGEARRVTPEESSSESESESSGAGVRVAGFEERRDVRSRRSGR